jgi:CelD/BcsL family acetyltransferase involved in cellulose biosynthesis
MTLLLEHDTTPMQQVTCIDARDLPATLADDWNRLAADMPLRRWEWLAPWWRHYRAAGDRLCVLVVRDQHGEVIGLAPWYQTRTLLDGRTLRFLGDNEICTDYQTLLADPAHADAVVAAVGDWLLGAGRGQWDTLDWRGKLAADPLLEPLTARLLAAGGASRQRPLEHSWRVELPATWSEFTTRCLSRNRREKLKALDRKYIVTGRAKLQTLTRSEDLDEYLEILQRLHQNRRADLGQAGCFANPTFKIYHREVLQNLLELDRLQLHYLELDGEPAASMYCLRGEGGIFQYQSGMDATREHLQPGWTCQLLAMRQGVEQGARFWDFLRGDEAYKASWGAASLPLVQQRLAAPRPVALLRQRWWGARIDLRQWAKRKLRTPTAAGTKHKSEV